MSPGFQNDSKRYVERPKSRQVAIIKIMELLSLSLEETLDLKYESVKKHALFSPAVAEHVEWLKSNDSFNKCKHATTYTSEFDGYVCVNEYGELYKRATLMDKIRKLKWLK